MTTEITKIENNAIATQTQSPRPASTVLSSDVLIPRLLLMQGLSKIVGARKAMIGDIVRNSDNKKMGDEQAPLGIIPLVYKNRWVLKEILNGKATFRGSVERNSGNELLPWEFEKDGSTWTRTKTIELFALLPSDIEADLSMSKQFEETGEMPDLNAVLLPVLITFQGKSFAAGKVIATHFSKVMELSARIPSIKPYTYQLNLGCKPDKNDKGEYFIFSIPQTASKVDAKYAPACDRWFSTLTQLGDNVKVTADEDEADGSEFRSSVRKEETEF